MFMYNPMPAPLLSCPARTEPDLIDLLQARQGMVCVVGAGGKKTTLYTLAARHPGRVGITTTVKLMPFPDNLAGQRIIASGTQLIEQTLAAARTERKVAFARHGCKDHRVSGLNQSALDTIRQQAGFDLLLVKADGARQRMIKAPADHEPVIPTGTTTVLALVSGQVIGRRLDDRIAHRLERLAAVTGAKQGEILQPLHIARLLTSEQGLLKNTAGIRVVPIINQVDDVGCQAAAEAARLALSLTDRFDYVVLAAMNRAQPMVEIIRRPVNGR